MSKEDTKRGKVTDENREESRLLKKIWESTYEDRKKHKHQHNASENIFS